MNQEVEQYLRLFIDHRQTDWAEWLACAEFSYNDKVNSSTGHSPFFVNYGRHPYKGTNPRREVKSQGAVDFAKTMKKIHEEAAAALKQSQETMKRFYDKKKGSSRDYKIGDKVWLEGNNIRTDRPMKKLDNKRHGPFLIKKKIGDSAYELDLPKTWRQIHPVFNESLLTPYVEPSYESQKKPDRPLPVILEEEETGIYEVKLVHDSRMRRRKLQYLIEWEGYPAQSDWTWEPEINLADAKEAIADFHILHPSAPRRIEIRLQFHRNPFNYCDPIPNRRPKQLFDWTDGKYKINERD